MKICQRFALIYRLASHNKLINRTIMSSSPMRASIEKVTEELKTNPYYEKYAKKIAGLQETSPEEFLQRIEEREKEKISKIESKSSSSHYSSLLEPKKQLTEKMKSEDESLDKIMKIDLIENKDANEIAEIWNHYHKTKDAISAIIPKEAYEEMKINAKKYPTFLFPIPRSQGYEFIMCQFFYNTVHFTPLLNYQVHKENAPECLKITHYPEFKDTKGIVLMKGEFQNNVINSQEAQCLANQLQMYYSQKDANKLKLLEQFTSKPDQFKHMDLIKQIETLNIMK
ncbi:ATP synthase mitochondrial F1 complex assembly factor 1-like isoform X1 [Photinus pyralis]|nr:ATP synthase mitochondrial F1 complex assembly factor 1-like isoform X1 [Photinus pyralis]XP_031359457.1 ATP synthase mitochondrial F1 complex assembly factor 1-like isoform X1 [Photinus pyralis]